MIKGPFSYEALPPEEIKFVPLNQEKEMNAKELMEFYEVCRAPSQVTLYKDCPLTRAQKDKHLGRYLHIIRDSPVYPVIYDANRTVLSLPPIINGNRSKITLGKHSAWQYAGHTSETETEFFHYQIPRMSSSRSPQ